MRLLENEILIEKKFTLGLSAENWQDVVRKGVGILEQSNCVEDRYYNAILDAVEKMGMYFVISKGVAMPHGRPEEGVLENGMSLITLQTPVFFGHPENDPVSTVLTIAAKDTEVMNTQLLVEVAEFFSHNEAQKELSKAITYEDLKKVFDIFNME
ncbi:MAG: PTS sugar transporter subunit IIA [Brevinema sp.]